MIKEIKYNESTDEYFIEIPELCEELDWREGDTLVYKEKNKVLYITNKSWQARKDAGEYNNKQSSS